MHEEAILIGKLKARLLPGAHDFTHIERVMRIASEIIEKDKLHANQKLLNAMILVHDLVRVEGEGEEESVRLTMKEAEKLLEECGYVPAEIEKVLQGIASHSLNSVGGVEKMVRMPETIEEKLLFDADKIDGLGYVGIARWFMTIGSKNVSVEDATKIYLKRVNDFVKKKGSLYTDTGSKLALERFNKSSEFMEKLLDEM